MKVQAMGRVRYLKITYSTKDYSREYINNPQNLIVRKQSTQKTHERHFSDEDTRTADRDTQACSTAFSTGKTQNTTSVRRPGLLRGHSLSTGLDAGTLRFTRGWWQRKTVQAPGKVWQVPEKLSMQLPYKQKLHPWALVSEGSKNLHPLKPARECLWQLYSQQSKLGDAKGVSDCGTLYDEILLSNEKERTTGPGHTGQLVGALS